MHESQLDASIIIPAFERTEPLRRTIECALAQDYDPSRYEVIVVDSSPGDSNVPMLEEMRSKARCRFLYFRKPPEGPGPSRNLGARESRGLVLAFLDSDCLPQPQWLREAVAAFEEGIGLVQGRTLPEPDAKLGPLTAFLRIEQETFIYEAANILYRREAFFQTDGFPADPHSKRARVLGGEDTQLAWAVKSSGWRSRFAPEALALHPVVPITLKRWLFNKHLFVFPKLVRRWPQIRRHLAGGLFFEASHGWALLTWAGVALALFSPWALVLALPYAVFRLRERSGTFRGPARLARLGAYFLRDSISLAILLTSSVRYGTILL
jgi:cellulose synthase/poly-beta-1,6-N-acetylglucosamine synthase-like glycosyltransferase